MSCSRWMKASSVGAGTAMGSVSGGWLAAHSRDEEDEDDFGEDGCSFFSGGKFVSWESVE